MHAAIVTSIATGLRQGELLRLRWQDVDFDKQCVTILQTKTDQPRSVYLPDPAVDALRKLRKGPVVALGPVFVLEDGTPVDIWRLNSRWRRIRRRAKLQNFRWYDLRHSCASYLAQHGATLLEIGAVLGHKSTAVTMRYAHLVSGKPVTGHAALAEKLRGTRQ